jgi:predicted RNA-binding protein with RPS1 domain
MKQVVPNPWDVIAEKYPVGTTIEGKIKNITDFGLFIGIDEGIDGLVHISDMSWTKRIRHPSELYKKGDEVQAVVLNIDKENERFALGIKQLQRDPWEAVPERYKVGSKITGTITNVTDFGVFVELEEGIEGLVHVSEVTADKLKTPMGRFQVGEVVGAKVLNINPKDRRIGLSMKQIEVDAEHDLVADYLSSYQGSPSSLGEVLKENLKEKSADEGVANQADESSAEKVDGDQEGAPEAGEQGEEGVSVLETEGVTDQTASEAEQETEATYSGDDEAAPSEEVTGTSDSAVEEPVDAEAEEKETKATYPGDDKAAPSEEVTETTDSAVEEIVDAEAEEKETNH